MQEVWASGLSVSLKYGSGIPLFIGVSEVWRAVTLKGCRRYTVLV